MIAGDRGALYLWGPHAPQLIADAGVVDVRCVWSGAEGRTCAKTRRGLSNECLVAEIGFDTAENEALNGWITDL